MFNTEINSSAATLIHHIWFRLQKHGTRKSVISAILFNCFWAQIHIHCCPVLTNCSGLDVSRETVEAKAKATRTDEVLVPQRSFQNIGKGETTTFLKGSCLDRFAET